MLDQQPVTQTDDNLINNEAVTQTDDDNNLINETADFILKNYDHKLLPASIKIGGHVLKKFFNNDIKSVSSRDSKKRINYNKLLQHKDMGLDASQLSRMIHVAYQEKLFKDKNCALEGLTYSHRIEFLKVKKEKKKLDIVNQCQEKSLSIRDLRALIKDYKKPGTAAETGSIHILKAQDLNLFDASAKKMLKIEKMLSNHDIEKLSNKMRVKFTEKAQTLQDCTKKVSAELGKLIVEIDEIDSTDKHKKESKS